MLKKLIPFVLFLIVLLLAACRPPAATPPSPDRVETAEEPEDNAAEDGITLVLGDISDDPGEVIEGTQPLADYLAERLADYGITAGSVRVVTTADEMIDLLIDGEVDLYFDSVYPATLIADEAGATPILRRWRFGVGEYYTIFFTSRDSTIESLDDLEGGIISFDQPFSTSGFAVPAAYLLDQGYALNGLQTYNDPPANTPINFTFSYDDENTIQWVLQGLVDAGATDSGSFAFYAGDLQDEFTILEETASVPRQVVLARAGMDPGLIEAIKAILIGMDETGDGQAVLATFGNTDQFDEFPDGIDAALDQMRDIRDTVQDIDLP